MRQKLGIDKTHLGVDLVRRGTLAGKDVGERRIPAALDTAMEAAIVVSPMSQQGFVLGRGNLQISPDVVRRVGVGNAIVIATPGKLDRTPCLRVDAGTPGSTRSSPPRDYLFVLVGYRTRRLHPVAGDSAGDPERT